jgi:hypothetical protein
MGVWGGVQVLGLLVSVLACLLELRLVVGLLLLVLWLLVGRWGFVEVVLRLSLDVARFEKRASCSSYIFFSGSLENIELVDKPARSQI